MNEETFKNFLEQNEQRLQKLENELSGKQAKPKKTDKKENDIVEFIEYLKKTNAAPEPEPGNDESDFIKMMKDINNP